MKGFKRLASTDFVFQDFDRVEDAELFQHGHSLIDFASSAYLGPSTDIINNDLEVAKQWGLRNHWSRISSNNGVTLVLEKELEKFKRQRLIHLSKRIHLFCQENKIKTLSCSSFPMLAASIKEEFLENIVSTTAVPLTFIAAPFD